jgi:hypothetical protein
LVLWNLLCFFSLLQTMHFGVCQALSQANPGSTAANTLVLTTALFGGNRKAANCVA